MSKKCECLIKRTKAKHLVKKDASYATGYVCDECTNMMGPNAVMYHCIKCGEDYCDECYDSDTDVESLYKDNDETCMDYGSEEEEEDDEEEEEDEDDDDIVDSEFILIGDYAKNTLNVNFTRQQLAAIGKIAKTMYYYKYGVSPTFNESLTYTANYYHSKDTDVVDRAVQFYRYG